jgi:Leucine-rich repeat (LRR) protein
MKDIEDYTFRIQELEDLNLRGNMLRSLSPNALNGASNLRTLDLSQNMIFEIDPKALEGLHSLQFLNLSNNKLNNQSFSNTEDMSINWNKEYLRTLDLSHNEIYYLDFMPYQSFSGLRNLEELYLQHNEISIDYGAFSRNTNLRTLDFSYNNLTYFDLNYLLSVRSLENLYLNGNGITYAQQIDLTDVRSSFPQIKSIKLSDNKFACEVLASMIRKLDKSGISLVVDDHNFIHDERNLRGVKCH